MAIVRRLLNQTDEKVQYLRVDHPNRFIVNEKTDWQFLFGPNSVFGSSNQILKIAAQLDGDSLNSVRFIAYLYNAVNGNVDRGATCTFNVYRVTNPSSDWVDTLITSFSGVLKPNSYFFADKTLSDLSPAELDGSTSLMVEVVVTRLSKVFRDRIYLNHLGIYDSVIRLRQDVEFLDVTKLDE